MKFGNNSYRIFACTPRFCSWDCSEFFAKNFSKCITSAVEVFADADNDNKFLKFL